MTEKSTDDDNDGWTDNHDGDFGNVDDNDDKNDQKHTNMVNFKLKFTILGIITW